MLEILKAIATRIAGSTTMRNGLAGGWWFKKAPQGQPMPYALIKPGTGSQIEYDTSARYIEPVGYDLIIVGRKVSDIAAIVTAWRDTMNWKALTLDTGHIMAATLDDEEQLDESPLEESRDCIQHVLHMEFTQQQSHQ